MIKIIAGEAKDIVLRVKDSATGDQYDLTGTTVSVKFKKADGTALEKSTSSGVTVLVAGAGKMKVSLSAVDTAALKVCDTESFEVTLTKSGVISKAQALRALSVIKSLF